MAEEKEKLVTVRLEMLKLPEAATKETREFYLGSALAVVLESHAMLRAKLGVRDLLAEATEVGGIEALREVGRTELITPEMNDLVWRYYHVGEGK